MGKMGNLATQGLVLCALAAADGRTAPAAPFELLYPGNFDTDEALNPALAGSPTFFTSPTAFTVRALFDTSNPNLAPPLGGPFAPARRLRRR